MKTGVPASTLDLDCTVRGGNTLKSTEGHTLQFKDIPYYIYI